jgi:hypothetical protein
MKKAMLLLLTMLVLVTSVAANYTPTYGKTDNLEISFDMVLEFLIGVAPYALYIGGLLLVYFIVKKFHEL